MCLLGNICVCGDRASSYLSFLQLAPINKTTANHNTNKTREKTISFLICWILFRRYISKISQL